MQTCKSLHRVKAKMCLLIKQNKIKLNTERNKENKEKNHACSKNGPRTIKSFFLYTFIHSFIHIYEQ